MKISAAVLRQSAAPLALETLSLEDPRADEVIIRVVSSGICHTDISAMKNPRAAVPMVFGHEGAGVVEAVGSGVTRLKPGDHVVVSFDYCGRCDRCLSGNPCYCREFRARNFSGRRPDGSTALSASGESINGHYFCQSSFANYVVAREMNAIKVRDDVPLELLGPLGCGIQTGAGTIMNAFNAPAGSTVAVFGTGSVGMGAILGAVAAGCTTIIGVDLNAARLEVSRQIGATHVVNARDGNVAEQIQDITRYGVNYAFDTTGAPGVLETALRSLDEMGSVALVGGQQTGRVDVPVDAVSRGRSIRTIIEGDSVPSTFIPLMIDLWAQGRFPFDKLVQYFPFEQINEAARASDVGDVIKPVLTFG